MIINLAHQTFGSLKIIPPNAQFAQPSKALVSDLFTLRPTF